VHTVRGVVTPAQPVLAVVPDNPVLQAEAHVENKDVGFVHAGQEVEIKAETFTFTRYGLIHGTVLDVSRDAVTTGGSSKARNPDGADENSRDLEARPDSAG
jgi:hemolysin D